MFKKYKKMGLAAATCTLLGISASHAAVTLTFSQVGSDVHATWDGDYLLPVERFPTTLGMGARIDISTATGRSDADLGDVVGSTVGTHINSGVTFSLGTYSGDTFGYIFGALFFPSDIATETYSPRGTMVFANSDLADIGANSFNNFLVFTGDNNSGESSKIYLHTRGIPEPSSVLLLGLGTLGLLTRRQRKLAA